MQQATTLMPRSGAAFDALVAAMQAHARAVLAQHGPHLFRVAPDADLYALYLAALPAAERQHHTCHTCQRFIDRYGALAAITADGALVSLLWATDVPAPYAAALAALRRAVERGRVSGVALAADATLGEPVTGAWTHFAVQLDAALAFRPGALSASQAAAAKLEDYRTLRAGLADYARETVAQAVTLLEADALYRSEKVLGPARFLFGLHELHAQHRGRAWDNLVWRAVAGAPAGWCQPRSSIVGTLLDDLKDGLDFPAITRRFAEKLHPLQYQRPSAAPAAGAIAQAEALVETLGIASALQRRFARLEEIPTLWTPVAPSATAPTHGIFGHLQPKGAAPVPPLAVPAQPITWQKFAATVLPRARALQVFVAGRMNFCALLTAVDPEAAPILQWDTAAQRNPVSWYVYHGGSPPEQWGLAPGTWVAVTAVTLQPSLWYGSFPQHGASALLLLAGCVDTHDSGTALFPETLRTELHGVRAVIEAHTRTQPLAGRDEASACGLRVGQPGVANQIRVTTATGVAVYSVDRWD